MSMTPVPFRSNKGGVFSAWKAIIPGKGVIELEAADKTEEQAREKLKTLLPEPTSQPKKTPLSIPTLLPTSVKNQPSAFAASTNTTASEPDEKPKPRPGELRTGGLSELSPQRLAKFREQIAVGVATTNVQLDRAILSLFRDKVPQVDSSECMMLATGWELMLEQYFVTTPPPWLVILLGNAMVCSAMYAKSEPKKEDEFAVNADGSPRTQPAQTHKQG